MSSGDHFVPESRMSSSYASSNGASDLVSAAMRSSSLAIPTICAIGLISLPKRPSGYPEPSHLSMCCSHDSRIISHGMFVVGISASSPLRFLVALAVRSCSVATRSLPSVVYLRYTALSSPVKSCCNIWYSGGTSAFPS